MAVLTHALCSVVDVQNQTGETYSGGDLATVENMIDLATQYAEKYIGRDIKVRSTDATEYLDLDYDTQDIFLRNFPIITITSVQEDPDADSPPIALVANDEYYATNNIGRLIRRQRATWFKGDGFRSVKVLYKGGYAAVPEDLNQWAIEVVVAMFSEKDRGNLEAERVGQVSQSYSSVSSLTPGVLSSIVTSKPWLMNVLNMYKGNHAT